MTPTEIKFLLWFIGILLAVIAFVGCVFISYFMQMAKDVNSIKTSLEIHGVKHDSLEKRVENIEHKLEMT